MGSGARPPPPDGALPPPPPPKLPPPPPAPKLPPSPPVRAVFSTCACAQRRLGPSSSAITSTTVRFSPSWVSHERCSRRPKTTRRVPLVTHAAAFSPSVPHATTLKKEVCSCHSPFTW